MFFFLLVALWSMEGKTIMMTERIYFLWNYIIYIFVFTMVVYIDVCSVLWVLIFGSFTQYNSILCESYIIVGFVCFYCTVIQSFCLVLDIFVLGLGSWLMGDRDRVKCSGSAFIWSSNIPIQWNELIWYYWFLLILFLFFLVMIEMFMVSCWLHCNQIFLNIYFFGLTFRGFF